MRLLQQKESELHGRAIGWSITGVATRRLGWLANPHGFAVNALSSERTLTRESLPCISPAPANVLEWLRAAQADVLFEASSLEPLTGQPAIGHIRAALELGAHAITANKGPIVHAYEELSSLAAAQGRRFLFESTVMDGVPIFSMFRDSLPTVQLKGFRGILNSTTNVILSEMEKGLSFEQALERAREIGVAETDASHDVEGWDAAVKVAALGTVLMRKQISLAEIKRVGISGLSAESVRAARTAGTPYKLVCCAARRENGAIEASVRPEKIPLSDPLAWVSGTSSIIQFETDIFPRLVITEINPDLQATAYGMLADFVRAVTE